MRIETLHCIKCHVEFVIEMEDTEFIDWGVDHAPEGRPFSSAAWQRCLDVHKALTPECTPMLNHDGQCVCKREDYDANDEQVYTIIAGRKVPILGQRTVTRTHDRPHPWRKD